MSCTVICCYAMWSGLVWSGLVWSIRWPVTARCFTHLSFLAGRLHRQTTVRPKRRAPRDAPTGAVPFHAEVLRLRGAEPRGGRPATPSPSRSTLSALTESKITMSKRGFRIPESWLVSTVGAPHLRTRMCRTNPLMQDPIESRRSLTLLHLLSPPLLLIMCTVCT